MGPGGDLIAVFARVSPVWGQGDVNSDRPTMCLAVQVISSSRTVYQRDKAERGRREGDMERGWERRVQEGGGQGRQD